MWQLVEEKHSATSQVMTHHVTYDPERCRKGSVITKTPPHVWGSVCPTFERDPSAVVKTTLMLQGKESACQCRRCRRHRFDPWVGKTPWRRKWQPTPVFLPGKFHGQRSLAGYGPWG